MNKLVRSAGPVSVAIPLLAPVAPAQPTGVTGYEATSIGVLDDGEDSRAVALDEFGRLAGASTDRIGRALVWINGDLIELPIPDGYERATVGGISPTTGVAVGATSAGIGTSVPVVWKIGSLTTLPNLPGGGLTSCGATDVSDSHWIVGTCSSPGRSALWIDGEPIDLGNLGGGHGNDGANDINELGEIVGGSDNPESIPRPYLWRDGVMIDIGGEPLDAYGGASGINNHTEVVGALVTQRRGFHWRDGVRTFLHEPHPCGGIYRANTINDAGLIVGEAADSDCALLRAAIWERTQDFRGFILDELMPRQPEIDLLDAYDINSAGQIAAYGENTDGDGRGYLVTPYQFELSDPIPGAAGERNTITVTGLAPSQRVFLVWGTEPGAQPFSQTCPGGTLLIRDPRNTIPPVRANKFGVATFNVMVPRQAQGVNVRYQAISPATCEISHTVDWTF